MGASLTQRRRVGEEGLRVVKPFGQGRVRTVPVEQVSANYVRWCVDSVETPNEKTRLYAGKLGYALATPPQIQRGE